MSGGVDWTGLPPAAWPAECAADLATAARAAVEGGLAARPHYRDDELTVRQKDPGDPVTEADHAANRAILRVLAAHAPGDPVRSEESAPPSGGVQARGRLWVVDPLDGTKEFIARNGEFAVMVGLARDGAARLGAVLQPDPGRLYVGVAAGGAWTADVRWAGEGAGNGLDASVGPFRALRVDDGAPARLRLARSRSHSDPLIRAVGEGLGASEVVSGSVGVKCSLIAEGRADLYVHPVPFLKEWDTCAPEAVLRGAGGRVSDCLGAALSYGKTDPRQPRGIFAARSDVWAEALPLVRGVTADKLDGDS